MKEFRTQYWDSGVFCSFLSKEEGRFEVVQDLLREAHAGRLEIITTSFALVEVLKLKGHASFTEESQETLTTFFEYPFIKVVNADREICELARTLRGMGHYSSHANGGGQLTIAFDTTQITSKANRSNPQAGDPCHPLAAGAHAPAIAIQERAVSVNPDNGPQGAGFRTETSDMRPCVATGTAVRRLTTVECLRLQGFPDDYLNISYRGKPVCDGPKYKAIGNSFCVNVVRWIGERIAMVDAPR